MKRFSDFKKVYEQEITLSIESATASNPTASISNDINAQGEQQPQTQVQTVQQEEVKSEPVKLFSKLFESREMAHVYHLQVKGDNGSYASHVALNVYYTAILEFVDELIEVYQGQYGIVEGYDIIDTTETKTKDYVQYFEELATYLKSNKNCINQEDTHLLNIVDEIAALIYKTLYKLKYNK